MSDLTLNLDDDLEARLRFRASQNGRSIEEEALQILYTVLMPQDSDERNAKSKTTD